MKPRLLVIGAVSMDRLFGPKGEMLLQGGGAFYTALAASFFTKNVSVVSRIGSDYRMDFLEDLKKRGVDISGIKMIEGQKSSTWTIKYKDERAIHLVNGVNVAETISPSDIPEDFLNSTKIVYLGSLSLQSTRSFIKFVKENSPDTKIAIDTKEVILESGKRFFLRKILPYADYYFPNRFEAFKTCGSETQRNTVYAAGRKLLKCVKEAVVIKDGSNGSHLFTREKTISFPIFKTNAIELTGAGDTFVGAFMSNLLEGKDLVECMSYGNAAASFAVEDYGMLRMYQVSHEDIKHRKNCIIDSMRSIIS